jgi:predicted NAD/FAD-dependent oxidoreductase
VRVVVVGAGLAGLTCARSLVDHGHHVVVLDKGRSPGGRLATRRIPVAATGEDGTDSPAAVLDHGAQFFTVRTEALQAVTEQWLRDGLVQVWCHGFETHDGHPRYVAPRGLNAVAKHLAEGLDVRCDTLVFAVRPADDHRPHGSAVPAGHRWDVVVDDGSVHPADAVVVTCPLPQSATLLLEAGVEVPEALWRTDYDRTIALLAVLDGPSAVPAPGGLPAAELDRTIWSFVADNQAKGVSPVPALTLHADAEWSEAWWESDPDEIEAALLEAAAPSVGAARILTHQVKRWRFATPRSVWPDPCWVDPTGTVVLAGDAFAGPRFEGAYTSGLAAATAVHLPDI